jgi:mRNA interferase MazF
VKKGDIVLIPFPFTDLSGNKLRPALILCTSSHDISVCFITTQFQWKDKFDFEINPSEINGLKKTSIVRISKFATIDKDLVEGRLGTIENKYINLLNFGLLHIFQLG